MNIIKNYYLEWFPLCSQTSSSSLASLSSFWRKCMRSLHTCSNISDCWDSSSASSGRAMFTRTFGGDLIPFKNFFFLNILVLFYWNGWNTVIGRHYHWIEYQQNRIEWRRVCSLFPSGNRKTPGRRGRKLLVNTFSIWNVIEFVIDSPLAGQCLCVERADLLRVPLRQNSFEAQPFSTEISKIRKKSKFWSKKF